MFNNNSAQNLFQNNQSHAYQTRSSNQHQQHSQQYQNNYQRNYQPVQQTQPMLQNQKNQYLSYMQEQ